MMGKITSKGFFEKYTQYLAYADNTTDLKKLAEAACLKYPRAREPLFWYAYCTGKTDRLLKLTIQYKEKVYKEYLALYENTNHNYEELVERAKAISDSGWFVSTERPYPPYPGPDWLPMEYVEVYRAWECVKTKGERSKKDKLTTVEYIKKIREKHSELTNEMLAQALGLRLRDIKALIDKGDISRVSEENCNRLFDFVFDYLSAPK